MLVSFFILIIMCVFIIGIPCIDRYNENNRKASGRRHMTQKDLDEALEKIRKTEEQPSYNRSRTNNNYKKDGK